MIVEDVNALTRDQAALKLKELASQLADLDYHYYTLAAPKVSDEVYDALRALNTAIEKKFPDLRRSDSPSFRVGSPPSKAFQKVKHKIPMLSLDNAFGDDELAAFVERVQKFLMLPAEEFPAFMAEPKIDGLSATLFYQKGQFVLGATRGDGQEGENITPNLKTIRNIPLSLLGDDIPESLEVRGEVYMHVEDFQKLNTQREEEGEPPFANPRNAAAGSLRQLDSAITAKRPLRFFAYYFDALSGSKATSQKEILNCLKNWGFSVNPEVALCQSFDDMVGFCNKIDALRPSLPYEIDGAVFKVNDLALQKRLGVVGRAPRHSIARKFAAQKVETRIEDIITQVGRTGVITPVACLTPVYVGGVIVSRATLHNAEEIVRKDVRIGDYVIIERAGDVIPKVNEVVLSKRSENSKPFVFPSHCPSCGTGLEKWPGQVAIRCPNGFECPAQGVERLKHFVSRDAFDIDGLGDKNIEFLYDLKMITSPGDIFTLEQRNITFPRRIEQYEGWGVLSVKKLFAAIESKKQISLEHFIFALGMPQIGQITAKALARTFKTFTRFLETNLEELLEIDGIGSNMAEDVMGFLEAPQNKTMIDDLLSVVSPLEFVTTERLNSTITDKVIVFTGTLNQMSRQEAKAQAERMGAKVTNTISSKTDILVAGEDAGSKLKNAKALDVKIISEQEWIDLLNSAGVMV